MKLEDEHKKVLDKYNIEYQDIDYNDDDDDLFNKLLDNLDDAFLDYLDEENEPLAEGLELERFRDRLFYLYYIEGEEENNPYVLPLID